MKPKRIGILMDPIGSIHQEKDTTLALMLEAQARGWEVAYMTLGDLFLRDGRAEGFMRYVSLAADPHSWHQVTRECYGPLSELDIILMRKDPPFDMEYIMATYILERAESDGVRVLNNPKALRDVNEKVWTAWFPQCCPPGLLTRSGHAIIEFLQAYRKVVIKPTCRMGGQSVFVISQGDPNTNVIIEELTQRETRFVQVQQYIPEIAQTGDKRILLVNGAPVEYGIARMPAAGDHRGNLAAGARAEGFTLTERDRWICAQIAPALRAQGLFFVGIDVIGDYMTEINVTSPTGVREIERIFGISVPSLFFDALA
jgi:glutathione synthase